MIIKVIEHKTVQNESDAEALVRYVKGERGMDEGVEKIAPGYGGQVHFDTSDTNRQLLLLRELMRETGSRRPLMHAVIAWEAGELPTPEQVDEAVEIWLKQLKLQGLPALWEVHENTACMHAHVVVCLVDPMTGAWRDPTFYKRDSQKAKAKIAKKQGWTPCAEDLYIPDPSGPGIMPNPDRGRRKKGPDLPPLRQGLPRWSSARASKARKRRRRKKSRRSWRLLTDGKASTRSWRSRACSTSRRPGVGSSSSWTARKSGPAPSCGSAQRR